MKDKDTFFSKKNTIRCKGKLIDLSEPKIMGILNVTPDSFLDGGRYVTEEAIGERALKLIEEGADFIDIGACSSRPGATDISVDEEIKRLDLALKTVRKILPEALISIDTYRPEAASFSVKEYGVNMINDIFAGTADTKMFETISSLDVPYIMMHMQGKPMNMQQNPVYENVIKDILFFFSDRLNKARLAGIIDIVIDPGFGFGKTLEHNYAILNYLDDFKIFGLPIMAGLSRKSMINKLLKISSREALNGTSVLNTIALMKGANILRVHDVKEAKEVITLVQKTNEHED